MPNYRRARIAGTTYFFTVNLANRSQRLLTDHVGMLRRAFLDTRSELPFTIDAIVILPEHLHCLWTLPVDDSDFSKRWHGIKTRFSRHLSPVIDAPKVRKGGRGIWQRGFWEHVIRNDDDFAAHVAYIHYNPVKHAHVARVVDWPYSSFHRYVRQGICPPDWAGGKEVPGRYGEE